MSNGAGGSLVAVFILSAVPIRQSCRKFFRIAIAPTLWYHEVIVPLLKIGNRDMSDEPETISSDKTPGKKESEPELQQFGRYRILSKLGEGGMGEVYRAEDSQLCRVVALKLLADEDDAECVTRFLREARATTAIEVKVSNKPRGLEYWVDGHKLVSGPYLALDLKRFRVELFASRWNSKGPLDVRVREMQCRFVNSGD